MPLTVRDKCIISGHLKTTSLSLDRVASCFDQIRGHASIRHRLSIPVLSVLVLRSVHNKPPAYFRSSGTKNDRAKHKSGRSRIFFSFSNFAPIHRREPLLKEDEKGKKRIQDGITEYAKFYVEHGLHEFEYTI